MSSRRRGLCIALVLVLALSAGCGPERGEGSEERGGQNNTDDAAICGDAIVDEGEVCDDGNALSESACPYGTPTFVACDASCSARYTCSKLP